MRLWDVNSVVEVAIAVAPPLLPLSQLTLEGGDHPLRAGPPLLVRLLLTLLGGGLRGLLGPALLGSGGGALLSLILQEVDVTVFVLDCLVVLKGGQPCWWPLLSHDWLLPVYLNNKLVFNSFPL